jgi:glutathione synthase/RimK-type ligase-like ATP-grasp enzyme
MRLCLLTPALDEATYAAIAERWLQRLTAALTPAGVAVEPRPWTQPGDLAGFDAVAPLLAWGYHQRPAAWSALLNRLETEAVRTINPAATLRWNTRKTYLAELEACGALIVPTLFVDRLTPEVVAQAHARFGADIIAKPQVSGAAFETVRLAPGDPLDGAPTGAAMLQPFMAAVNGEGELSLLYFGGHFSHALGKVAAGGDFRVQVQYGGVSTPIAAPADALDAAERVLAAAPAPLTYARIDMIRGADGVMRLMELEAIEPDLFLEHSPDGGAKFAQAMVEAMAR